MLKTIAKSSNKKTGAIATTYRAGKHHTFGTCPTTCALNPNGAHGAALVDRDYLAAVYSAVPRNGQAWTYSHFHFENLPKPAPGKTTINYSADTIPQAVAAVRAGHPATVAAPAGTVWPYVFDGVQFVQCPEQLSSEGSGFTCASCGNGRPLCARGDRDYVIVFVAHGSQARKVAAGANDPGGCYAGQGHAAIAWHATRKTGAPDDAAAVAAFARSLPPGSLLRHHIAGDFGRAI